MSTKWTPGPWSLQREGTPFANNRVWPVSGRDPICSLSSFGSSPADIDPTAQANGRLIAAAPELYDALKRLSNDVQGVLSLDDMALRSVIGNTNHAVVTAQLTEARAVLRKATGEP